MLSTWFKIICIIIKLNVCIYINIKVFEREISDKYVGLLELDEIISDIESLCNNKNAVNKMKLKIVELKNKLNKLSPLSQQVNILQIFIFIFHYYCLIN